MPRKGMSSVFIQPASDAPSAVHAFRETLAEDNIASAERIINRWDPDGGSDYSKITSLFHESKDEASKFIQAVHDVHQAMLFFSSSAAKQSSSSSYTAVLVRAQRLMQIAMNRLQKEFYQMLAANRDRIADYSMNSVHSSARSSLSEEFEVDREIYGGSGSNTATDDEGDDVVMESVSTTGTNIFSTDQPRVSLPPDVTSALRSISQCMVSTGYTYECLEVYKSARGSIIHDGLASLGFNLTSLADPKPPKYTKNKKIGKNSNSGKDRDDPLALDRLITSWVAAAPAAVRTLFAGERLLCETVFGNNGGGINPASPAVPIKYASFAAVAADAAFRFIAFPETIAARLLKAQTSGSSSGRSMLPPQMMFGLLDMYSALTDVWPVVDSVFSSASTSHVRKQVPSSLAMLGDATRTMIANLELTIQKNASKVTVSGGGLHPLTGKVMDYVIYLADDYAGALVDVYADNPFQQQPAYVQPFSTFDGDVEIVHEEQDNGFPTTSTTSFQTTSYSFPGMNNVSNRLAWLLLVLLCKLDEQAQLYKDRALSYLFLANNLRYLVDRVRRSKRLLHMLGQEWDAVHDHKARSYLKSFVKLAWGEVAAIIPSDDSGTFLMEKEGTAGLRERMHRFNLAFQEACRRQSGWVVFAQEAREDVRAAVTATVVEPYSGFYEKCRLLLHGHHNSIVGFAPEEVANTVADLYVSENPNLSGPASLSGSSVSSPRSPAYSWSGSSTPKTDRGFWRAAIRRLTRHRTRTDSRVLDLGPASPSTSV